MKKISFLQSNDLIQVLTIEKNSNAMPWNKNIFLQNQGQNFINLKIHHKNNIIGFAITQIILDEASLLKIAIDPIYRKNGYANQLLRYLIKILKMYKISKIWLEVRTSNQIAIKLYKKLNFHQVTRRINYYPALHGREDAIVMVLFI